MVFGTRKNSNKANHHLWTPIVSDYDNCQSDAESSCTRWNEKNVFARSEKFLRYLSDIIKYIMVSNNKVNAKFVYKFIYIFENNILIIINNMFIIIKNSKIKSNIILLFNIRYTTSLPPFFSEIRGFFIVKNWLYIYDSKYYPSLATTFSHLSDSVRIPRRKNWSSFEAIHESIQFFTSS